MHKIVDGYEKVADNLNAHVHPNDPYPTTEYLRSSIKMGAEVLFLERIEVSSEQPLWILCWAGTNVLASVLLSRKYTFFLGRCRVTVKITRLHDLRPGRYWRVDPQQVLCTYPDIFCICSIHGWSQCGLATWSSISGERWYGFDHGGPDPTRVSKDWIRKNIQIGPLGSVYPDVMVIPEGDTLTFLYLIQNSLGVPEHPDYGSWGRRYNRTSTTSGNRYYSDVADEMIGLDGRKHKSNQATIWRWRNAF
ncbi:conserved hypothetical protein [Talaromyces stipitatus ATCC 10500]|uniref:Cellulose-binding Sde182 nucleoside hydrolase-like domain-containing protein n=1 Tax=Talaromyces stipitatus (strain ATCC 10500 / CBS 375.48 / QM 6759 / NRRL 1006) TaxID=441959 RepID=B8MBH2_TALSN|nr:uncharacterized protein TSTA_116260 [Talaromyces stipitatus ATCC 10500]EED17836.1 conserved hypothetical protein [Talaromyces stipitatus ATCC 10500]